MKIVMKPTSVIESRLQIEDGGKVHKFFTETCAKKLDKYVPMDTGTLAETVVVGGSVTKNVTADKITYSQQYASYVYFGQRKDGSHKIRNYSLDKHPLAGPYWDKRMVTAEIKDIEKEVGEYMKRVSK